MTNRENVARNERSEIRTGFPPPNLQAAAYLERGEKDGDGGRCDFHIRANKQTYSLN